MNVDINLSARSKRTSKVLQDHVKKGKKLVPPFLHHFGAFEEVSWRNDILPQIAWIGIIHRALGDVRAVELLTTFTRIVRKQFPKSKQPTLMGISEFGQIKNAQITNLVNELKLWPNYYDLYFALSPLLTNYPNNPLSKLILPNSNSSSGVDSGLDQLSNVMFDLLPRHTRTATMTQATATWFAFDSRKLVVNESLPLAQFPEIQNYPETEISMKVASGVRTTVNMFISQTIDDKKTRKWNHYFWNRGFELSGCRPIQ